MSEIRYAFRTLIKSPRCATLYRPSPGTAGSTQLVSSRVPLRTLRKRPGPTLVVVVTLGVAIASVTLIYSAIDLVQYILPIANRDGLVYVTSTDTRIIQQGSGGRSVVMRVPTSIPDLADWSTRNTTFDALAGFSMGSANLTRVDIPMRVSAIRMTANLPGLWGLRPDLGRSFRPGPTGSSRGT